MPSRRFPPPWTVEDTGAVVVVKDVNGQKLGDFYYEEESGRRLTPKMLTEREARRIAAIAGLLETTTQGLSAARRRCKTHVQCIITKICATSSADSG